jgi:tetratricopeptide (TPR) repeat protein
LHSWFTLTGWRMAPKGRAFLILFFFAASAAGCASMLDKRFGETLGTQEAFVQGHLRKALECEKKRALVEALTHYKIAETAAPGNQEILDGRARVEDALHRKAEKHYRRGVNLRKKGKYGEARKQFLTALRLRPDYPEVIEVFTSRKRKIPSKAYLIHRIEPGESLSALAMRYYGDYHKFPIIAEYNNITDATRVDVGQEIKIPEIAGFQFPKKTAEPKIVEKEEGAEEFWDWVGLVDQDLPGSMGGGEKEVEEDSDQVAFYLEHGLELFKDQRYQEAVLEFNKVLCVYPTETIALEFSYKACYRMAMALFENQDYLGAREQFIASLRYKKDCHLCQAYIERSEDLYKELHYKKGIQHYGREQLVEAITEWELVKRLDPDYKRVEYYINKAQAILNRLEELKEDSSERSSEVGKI